MGLYEPARNDKFSYNSVHVAANVANINDNLGYMYIWDIALPVAAGVAGIRLKLVDDSLLVAEVNIVFVVA